MRRKRRFLISLMCGVLAVFFAWSYAETARQEVRAERSEVLERYGGEVTTLIVAKSTLSSGDVISESSVEAREWLSDLAPSGSVTNLDDVLGLRLTSNVAKGEPLNELDIAAQDGALEVPEGRVAVSVRLSDKTGLAQEVGSGSAVLAWRLGERGLELISSEALVLSNASVSSTTSKERICLAVLPADVEAILEASSDGSLRLALPGDGVEASSIAGVAAPSEVTSVDAGDESEDSADSSAEDASSAAEQAGLDD